MTIKDKKENVMELKVNGQVTTLDVKDRFLVVSNNSQDQAIFKELHDRVKDEGGLGVLFFEGKVDVRTLEPKDKLLVIKSDDFSSHMADSLREQLYKLGCLGFINLPSDSDVESLGVKQLEDIAKEIKSMRQKGVKDEE